MRPPTDSPSTDPRRPWLTTLATAALAVSAGCHHRRVARSYPDDDAPPPPVVTTYGSSTPAPKPLPPQGDAPPYTDPALVRQQVPEEPRYVQAYNNIGRPKVLVFVNRTVTGELVPVTPSVTVRRGLSPYDDRTTTYLQPGQYDEAQARSIDYELIENLLTDDLSAGQKVMMISPTSARQRLTDADWRDVQAGRPQMLGELALKLNADVLVQVTARPSQQTDQGLGIRLIAEALNTHGGQAIAFATADVPPPLTQGKLNEYVRFVSRKLMDGMSTSWEDMAAPAPSAGTPPPPSPPPAPAPSAPAPNPLDTSATPTPPPAPTAPPPSIEPAKPSPATTPGSKNPLDLPPPP